MFLALAAASLLATCGSSDKKTDEVKVHRVVRNVTDGQRMVKTATVGRQQADENLRMMRQKYDNQLCTMTNLLDAQGQWQQAHSSLIEA